MKLGCKFLMKNVKENEAVDLLFKTVARVCDQKVGDFRMRYGVPGLMELYQVVEPGHFS